MRTVKVPLGERSYSIQIGSGLLFRTGAACRQLNLGRRCAIITDEQAGRQYGETVRRSLAGAGFDSLTITLAPGEKSKNLGNVQRCYDLLARHRLERESFVVALGGGVVGDLAGFVAATYLRGVAFVQIPTTLLAQVDSSVGGKVGVNLKAGKNLVGAFHQPRHVFCDLDSLKTLPPREFKAGLAEIVKYGIIYDARLFGLLEKEMDAILAMDPALLNRVIGRSCAIKAEVVEQDEREGGLRAILNFGHTVGHAIEATSGYGHYLHGEAISIGQIVAAEISRDLAGLSEEHAARIRKLFQRAGLPVNVKWSDRDLARIKRSMSLDKKVRAGVVQFVLAEKIGKATWGHSVSHECLDRALASVRV